MGEQRNLTEENVEELKERLEHMKENNPDLEYGFWEQDGKTSLKQEQPSNKEIFEKLEALEGKIKMIFDGHVLIDGVFKKIVI